MSSLHNTEASLPTNTLGRDHGDALHNIADMTSWLAWSAALALEKNDRYPAPCADTAHGFLLLADYCTNQLKNIPHSTTQKNKKPRCVCKNKQIEYVYKDEPITNEAKRVCHKHPFLSSTKKKQRLPV